MGTMMIPELYWAVCTALMTALFWVPHIAQRIVELGPYEAFRDPRHDIPTRAAWAQRAIRAHANAVENLIVFSTLAVAVAMTETQTTMTAAAAAIYFGARFIHYGVYVTGIPWLRTPAFLTGFGCQMLLALTILGFV